VRPIAFGFVLVAVVGGWQAAPAMAAGTKIKLRDSDYGRMLFGPGRQAIYIFERYETDKSNCYGECARDWPPVLTEGKPVAGDRVRQRLLGRTTGATGRSRSPTTASRSTTTRTRGRTRCCAMTSS
jgi:predicted lipoprotein with Yx(FWY)xxD motif